MWNRVKIAKVDIDASKPRQWIERISSAYLSHSLKAMLGLRTAYMNVLVERAQLARAVGRAIMSAFSPITTSYRMASLAKSSAGKSFLVDKVLSYVGKYLDSVSNKQYIMNKLVVELSKVQDSGVSGKEFVRKLEKTVLEVIGDKKTASKIVDALNEHVNQGVVRGKNAVYDIVTQTLYTNDGQKISVEIFGNEKKFEESAKVLKEKFSIDIKKAYAELKLSKIVVKVLTEARSSKEAAQLFETMLKEELAKDTFFVQGFKQIAWRELVKTYNAGALMGALHETLTTLPTRLVSLASRVLAAAYRMLPLVGAIAAVNAEAAAAVAEFGEGLKNKIEQSAYSYYDLKDLGVKIPTR